MMKKILIVVAVRRDIDLKHLIHNISYTRLIYVGFGKKKYENHDIILLRSLFIKSDEYFKTI